ncbi:hypothetical protein CPAR01_10422 [Colletotrichum paranaense]|uniref:Uncharacterized protein n=1 Tax=Colletotrichum paranaense TaxID=1914294 RepID=A0ABQ9SDY1_9PEZI|nr:uncharacterized protein CPAR01_10422 [Colletotrichum paranaense]KAK1533714.1 hypothetical protein CPAR01_10422 [Colletotrichum paranaense]
MTLWIGWRRWDQVDGMRPGLGGMIYWAEISAWLQTDPWNRCECNQREACERKSIRRNWDPYELGVCSVCVAGP